MLRCFGYTSYHRTSFNRARHHAHTATTMVQFNIRRYISSVETIYERKTPLEHILLRPGMYVGQTEIMKTDTWLIDEKSKKMMKQTVEYSPALLKIFDEILINAADNIHRDSSMSRIEITAKRINDDEMEISIMNDGKGIPIQLHRKENLYVPELIFGHLLTGSNFNDEESRLTGGSHGYGAKLTNIFSTYFAIETYDKKRGLLYQQNWRDNMSITSQPVLQSIKLINNYTKITFHPDLKKFGIKEKDNLIERIQYIDTMLKIFERRAYDVAACIAPKIKVYYNSIIENNESLPITSFHEYVQLFHHQHQHQLQPEEGPTSTSAALEAPTAATTTGAAATTTGGVVYYKMNSRWEFALMPSPTDSFEQLSFVNNVWTIRGGTHVQVITQQIIKAFETILKNEINDLNISITTLIKNKLMIFINCSIENPAFDGQTKDLLNTKPILFGSNFQLSTKILKKMIYESNILELLKNEIIIKSKNQIKNSLQNKKKIMNIPKLEDAHDASSSIIKKRLNSTLILTEGDSAKALAVAGLEVLGRKSYGILPLRGKVLNVRIASNKQLLKNQEFLNLCKVIGLDFNKTYEDLNDFHSLRYGKILIMCDQDHDGSHIKGLLINYFHYLFPALLKYEGFLSQFITPIIKIKNFYNQQNQQNQEILFYNLQEFQQFHEKNKKILKNNKNIKIKYYKGLGTNTSKEGKEYFKNLKKHQKVFKVINDVDNNIIDMVFNKKRVEDRRLWLKNSSFFLSKLFINYNSNSLNSLSYNEFINKELIQFSYYDILRSIPNVIDGLKPSQRKVLYGGFKKKLKSNDEIKVVQFAGFIAENTAYHHGENSLHSTIINMSQDYIGANNIPLFHGIGQFGTRASGGKDYASPRYIYTTISSITRYLFPIEDDGLLEYLEEDGLFVEPKYYIPIIPVILLNGSKGIGTGWSTYIPSFNLYDIVTHVKQKIKIYAAKGQGNDNDNIKNQDNQYTKHTLQPFVKGFRGIICNANENKGTKQSLKSITKPTPPITKYRTTGIIKKEGKSNQVRITELPVGRYTEDYKKILHRMIERGVVKDFKEFHGTETVDFLVTCSKSFLKDNETSLETSFRLHSTISMNNMHAFDANGRITKYLTPEEIIDAHFPIRLAAYERRKDLMEKKLAAEEMKARNKSLFIETILTGQIDIMPQAISKKASTDPVTGKSLHLKLQQLGFNTSMEIDAIETGIESLNDDNNNDGYNYLLDMPIQSLTKEKSIYLKNQALSASERLQKLQATTVLEMWETELDALVKKHEEMSSNDSTS